MSQFPIEKEYFLFCRELNKKKIKWTFIKDLEFLLENKYDNEIDITAFEKDRNKIREIAVKLNWRESSNNKYNTHLIFWKFEKKQIYRIDVHLDKVLATAAPLLKTRDIIKKSKKNGELYNASEEFELAIIFLSCSRGRNEIKDFRVKRIKQLKKYKNETLKILPKKIQKEFLNKFEIMEKGKKISVNENIRLNKLEQIKQHILNVKLLINRIFNPSPHIYIRGESEKLKKIIKKSKQNIKFIKLNNKKQIYLPWNFYKKYFCDFLFIKGIGKESYNIKDENEFFNHIYNNYYKESK